MSEHLSSRLWSKPRPPRLRSARPFVEALENRTVPTLGTNSFAIFHGDIGAAGERDAFAIRIRNADFNLQPAGVLLGITMHAADGSALDPAAVKIAAGKSGTLQIVHDSGNTDDNSSFTLARFFQGDFTLRASAQGGTTGAYQIDVFIAGDANGDARVNGADAQSIFALKGTKLGQPGYNVDADVNRDGKINQTDVAMVNGAVGCKTSIRPLEVGLQLSAADDPNGNSVVIHPDVDLVATSRPGVKLQVDLDGNGTFDVGDKTDASGQAVFAKSLLYGDTTPGIVATDNFGQVATSNVTLARQDVALNWNKTLLDAIRVDRTGPPQASRFMAMVQVSVYDAVNAILGGHAQYFVTTLAPAGASAEAAAVSAAYNVLINAFPAQKTAQTNFDALLTSSLAEIPNGQAKTLGLAWGEFVANEIMTLRSADGSNVNQPYVPGTAPGEWRPTPPGFLPALAPQWRDVTPWALQNNDQFLPDSVPALDTPEYAAFYNQVKEIGAVNSTTRTQEQTNIAQFWANGGGTSTPPGHWNVLADIVAQSQNLDLGEIAHLLAKLDLAAADAAIASWTPKFDGNFWRPVTAIREGDTDGNPDTEADPDWLPLIVTPPFPAYISGHATFSSAAAAVLKDYFGTDNIAFTLPSENPLVGNRSFTSFSQAAAESAVSRLYGGIHWDFDDTNGLKVGQEVGEWVAERFLN